MLSLAITAYDELSDRRGHGKRLLRSLRPAQISEHVDEIVVVDDGSSDFAELSDLVSKEPKVRLHHNSTNLGVFGNKIETVLQCNPGWVINCDSDNLMDESYLNHVASMPKRLDTWYSPSFAHPKFDYRRFIGVYDLTSLNSIIDHRMAPCLFNTGNQVVNRNEFASVFGQYQGTRADLQMPNYLNIEEDQRDTHHWRMVFDACDSFVFNMEWILDGNNLCVEQGLEYEHRYASGDDGNYARSPIEKEELARVLMKKLAQAVRRS